MHQHRKQPKRLNKRISKDEKGNAKAILLPGNSVIKSGGKFNNFVQVFQDQINLFFAQNCDFYVLFDYYSLHFCDFNA